MSFPNICKKCGSLMDRKGFCKDETCPFHDWQQLVPLADLHTLSTEEVERKHGLKKREA